MAVDPDRTRRSYDAVAERYAAELLRELDGKPLDRALLAVLAADVGGRGGGPLADLGGGPGHVADLLRRHGACTLVVDLSPAMATIAHRDLGLAGVAGSMTALPLPAASLGGAVAFYSLIHLDDAGLAATAAELARVLQPDAPFLAGFHLGEEVRHLDEWWGHEVDVDFRFLTVPQVSAVLEEAGLVVEAVLERSSLPHEVETRRGYVLARRSSRSP